MCTLQGFYYHVLEQLQIPVPNSCTLARFIDAVSQHLVNPAVILMDEIQVALQAPELGDTFWWGLRSLGTNLTEGRLGFILSSQTIRDDLYPGENSPSPFFNIFGHLIELGPLRKEEAYELINSSPDPFNTDDVEWIINTSQCWPALIQLLAMACWTHIRSGDEGHYWRPEALNSMKRFQYLLDSN